MKIAVAVLTYNRLSLLRRTLASLEAVPGQNWTIDIVDNGSTDGSAEFVRGNGGYANTDGNHTTGHGMNLVISMALERRPDIVLFTADDYEYKRSWLDSLEAWYGAAPADVVLTSLNLEPAYGWNGISEFVEYGGVRGVIRASLPGSLWSFRASDWPKIGPIREATGGEDLEICQRLQRNGYKLAALNLSEHTGEKASAWGNQSWHMAQPLANNVLEWMEAV